MSASSLSDTRSAELYRRALRSLPDTIDEQPPLPVPSTCPVTLDELLEEA